MPTFKPKNIFGKFLLISTGVGFFIVFLTELIHVMETSVYNIYQLVFLKKWM